MGFCKFHIFRYRVCSDMWGTPPDFYQHIGAPGNQMQITLRKRLEKSSPTYIMWKKSVRIDWWSRNQHSGSGTLRKSSVKSRNRGCGSEARKIEKIKISIFLISGLYCTRTGSVITILSLLTSKHYRMAQTVLKIGAGETLKSNSDDKFHNEPDN